MYLCYPERSDLASVALAVVRSYLPKGAMGEAIKLFNEQRKRDAEKKRAEKAERRANRDAPSDES